ncbi:protocadherin Fat 3-like [Pomacea canaliculata]|uniref:protocadherin Fat 3-like n=1 Tax=Pomacea canaliculata TaxID=400727 RepID=UPI000D72739A|nr:protocadherin Fat 3-like [Pomacea canaliculata]
MTSPTTTATPLQNCEMPRLNLQESCGNDSKTWGYCYKENTACVYPKTRWDYGERTCQCVHGTVMVVDDASNFTCVDIYQLFRENISRQLASDVEPNREVYSGSLTFNDLEITLADFKYSLYPSDSWLSVTKNGLNFSVITNKRLPQANAVYFFVLRVDVDSYNYSLHLTDMTTLNITVIHTFLKASEVGVFLLDGSRKGTIVYDVTSALGSIDNTDLKLQTDTAVTLFELQSNRRIVCVKDVDINSIRISSDAIGHVVTLSLTSSGQVVLVVKVAVIVASTRLTIPENNLPNKNVVTFSSLRESFDIAEQHRPVDLPLILTPNRTAIQLTRGLDFEKDPKSFQITVSLQFRPSPQVSTSVSITVDVTDINDSPPRFLQSVYIIIAPYCSENGTLLGQLAVEDQDSLTQTFSFQIVPSRNSSLFRIRDSAGILEATKKLPEDAGANGIVINVIVSDGVNTSPTPTTVIIYVSRYVQEFELVGGNYSLSIVENIPVGTEVFNASLTNYTGYQLLPASVLYYFTINQTTGIIRTRSEIDREVPGPQENMNVVAFQQNDVCKLKTVSNITLTILDENDNPPVFDTSLTYAVKIPENSPNGTFVFKFSATDKDYKENATLTYSITSGNSPFRIDSATGNVTVADSSRLDREVLDTLRLVVTVVDGGTTLPPNLRKSASINLTVTLEDVNDNDPVFNQSVYTVSVYENISVNSNLTVVRATDRDINFNGQVRYSLGDGVGIGSFAIDYTTGQLRNRMALDREQYELFTFTVIASDLGSPPRSSSATVVVKVLDVNDNIPQFQKAVYLPNTIDEGISCWNKSFVTVTAEDKDSGLNSEIVYSIESDLLVINSSTGEVTCKAAGLDYENVTQRTFDVVVRASDKGTPPLTSTSVIRVTVRDVNDNPLSSSTLPTTSACVWRRLIPWTALSSCFLCKTTMSHKSFLVISDSGENSEVDLRLTNPSTNGAGLLTVSNLVLRVNRTGRPTPTNFSYTVIATDRGRAPLSSSASVYIYVSDSGSSRVTFDPKDFLFKIVEEKSYDESSGIAIGKLTATTLASPPVFSLFGATSFSVNSSTGHLFCSKVWDRERDKDSAELTIMARASVEDYVDYALVKITLLDINDNSPSILTNPSALVGNVLEDAEKDTFIISLEATDPDEGPNGTVIFSMEGGMPFRIETANTTGKIFVNGSLDRERKNEYVFTVWVRDNAKEPRSVSVSVTILIDDVNDNAPTFVNMDPIFVPENTSKEQEVGMVSATDLDQGRNGMVTYSIDNSSACPLKIRADVGTLLLREDLDYETVKNYTCIIEASDQGDPRLSSTANFTILVTDINDNAPVIHSAVRSVNVTRDIEVNYVLVESLNVTDADFVSKGAISFYFVDPANPTVPVDKDTVTHSYFNINPATGAISMKSSISNFPEDDVMLTIAAKDYPPNQPTLWSNPIQIQVHILDASTKPKFNDIDSINITEGPLILPRVLTRVSAFVYENKVRVDPCNCSYSINNTELGNGSSLKGTFSINAVSGEITLNASLDREATGNIIFITLFASDFGSPPKTGSATLNVSVVDINDNIPKFSTDSYQITVTESSCSADQVLYNITAHDADEPPTTSSCTASVSCLQTHRLSRSITRVAS